MAFYYLRGQNPAFGALKKTLILQIQKRIRANNLTRKNSKLNKVWGKRASGWNKYT